LNTMNSVGSSENKRQKGNRGEQTAVEHLLSGGYSIICRQYRSKTGEIDIVARDSDGTLVFIEVKSSAGNFCGSPLYRVTPQKQRKLARMALQYITEHKISGTPCRFDVIAVVGNKIDHLKNAFLV